MKLGIAVNTLGPSQLNYLLVKQANALLAGRTDLDIVAFYEGLARPSQVPHFASMQMAEGWCFDGPVVATTLSTAEKLLRFPATPRRLFYCWDLEWVRVPRRQYAPLRHVYGNPELTLIARTQEHARIIRQCWNREAQVVEEFDLPRLIEAAFK